MAQPGYVFIVGAPRTGTSLLRNTLNCSQEVGICRGESHFFERVGFLGLQTTPGFRQRLAKVGDLTTEDGARKIVDFIYDCDQNHYWNQVRKNVDREEFLRRLLESDRTDRSLLDLAMAFCAGAKPIRGEKTPAHIYNVPTLLEWFPNARIIHMCRDPRAIYVSQKKKSRKSKQQPYSAGRSVLAGIDSLSEMGRSLAVITSWLRIVWLHHRYQRLYPHNYCLVRFEDLIGDPQTTLKRICGFLEIDFNDELLQQTVVNSSFVSPKDRKQGFDTDAIDRWREHLHPATNYWFVLCCKKQLLKLGYRP